VDAIAVLVEGFDPDVTGARDAVDLVSEFTRLEHLASAGLAQAARRVAETDLWQRGGHRSAAHRLSGVTGSTVGDAVRLLEAAKVVQDAPDTLEAMRSGAVSPHQARAIGAAEKADPGAAQELLAQVGVRSTAETDKAAARVVAARSPETPDAKAERHRRARRVTHGVDGDGMGWGNWKLPMAEHTRIVSLLEGETQKVFAEARAAGEREPVEAYAADALSRIFDRAARKAPGAATAAAAGEDSGHVEEPEDWSFSKIIVKVDLTALDRGSLAPGEVCEVAGQGPIPVADVWRMIDGDAFIAAVTTTGTEIDKVVHLGRKPTVLQQTALEWFSARECSIEGCASPARIETDHVAEWAHTHTTRLSELATPCGYHHDLKTHHGHHFGPRLPSGKRRLIPPDGAGQSGAGPPTEDPQDERPPGSTSPGLTLLHGDGGTGTTTGVEPDPPAQGDLFDTG
jgi:hypothetical protein